MNARILATLLLLVAAPPTSLAAGPTLVSGNVSGTWSPSGNPYVIVDNCTVPHDKTLTIMPGTEVIIGQGLNLTVTGNIIAKGTAAERIVFTAPNTTTYWGSVTVNGSTKTNEFGYCNFERGSSALVIIADGISVGNATVNVSLSGVHFSDCYLSAVTGLSVGYATTSLSGHHIYNPHLALDFQGCKIIGCPNGVHAKPEDRKSVV